MGNFELISRITDLLRSKDANVWQEILEKTLEHKDPYESRAKNFSVIDVSYHEGVPPDDLIAALQSKEKMQVDERIIKVFECIKGEDSFRFLRTLPYLSSCMIGFHPYKFGVEYTTYLSSGHERPGVLYAPVVEAALKYGFRQPSFITALYFRLRFLDAHRYEEGVRYLVGCEPKSYDPDKPPIIPMLEYDRYVGWELGAQEVGPETLIDMSSGTGQGEHFHTEFVFAL